MVVKPWKSDEGKAERMQGFLDWYHNKIKGYYPVLSQETHERIMEKI